MIDKHVKNIRNKTSKHRNNPKYNSKTSAKHSKLHDSKNQKESIIISLSYLIGDFRQMHSGTSVVFEFDLVPHMPYLLHPIPHPHDLGEVQIVLRLQVEAIRVLVAGGRRTLPQEDRHGGEDERAAHGANSLWKPMGLFMAMWSSAPCGSFPVNKWTKRRLWVIIRLVNLRNCVVLCWEGQKFWSRRFVCALKWRFYVVFF